MPASIALLHKTPFHLDPRPLSGCASPHAGLLSVSRTARALHLPGLIEANVSVKQRDRGLTESQYVESILLSAVEGGEGYSDLAVFAADPLLEKGLGYAPAQPDAARKFLEAFHDPDWERARPPRDQQKTFFPEPTDPLVGLGRAQAGLVHNIARAYAAQDRALPRATLDADATLIFCEKRDAKPTYEGPRGYQPLLVAWAEADLVVADQFREGNVPARQAPLSCVRAAFAALPATVTERFFRGDSACHENELLAWLSDPKRAEEPGGAIGFAVSAVQSEPLAAALRAVREAQWQTFGTESDGTLRQWAELDFVPALPSEHKDAKPLRYVGLRLVKPQGELFADGNRYHYHAVITNRELPGDELLPWHRQKAGTIEHVHDEVKNDLGGARLPSGKFGANAAWLRILLMAYNVVSAQRALALGEQLQTARLKRLRLHVYALSGRMSHTGNTLKLRLHAGVEAIRRLQRVWAVFALPTQATWSG
jgi:hypothetical protein